MYRPVARLFPAGELDLPVHGRGNVVPPPPHPPASVELWSSSGAAEKKRFEFNDSLEHICFTHRIEWAARVERRLCVRAASGNLTLLSPWASVSLWVSSFTSSVSCFTRSLESLNSWARFTWGEGGEEEWLKWRRKMQNIGPDLNIKYTAGATRK